ncbi:hypothetical protein EDD15DRAFT_2365680 [Pisolithus albus]|nr:hypothetical protein EDD15DRAFT_2365680 [Pisolithus albus]
MKTSIAGFVDDKIFRYASGNSNTRLVNCMICPPAQGKYREFHLKHLKSHRSSHVHQRHLKLYASGRTTLSGYKSSQCMVEELITPLAPGFSGPSNTFDETISMDIDDHRWVGESPDESESMFVMPESPSVTPLRMPESEDDRPVPLSELWHAISTSRHQKIDGTRDLFQELQDALASGEALFSTPLSPVNSFPSDDIACDAGSDFGIELSDNESDETFPSNSEKTKASPESPTYLLGAVP